MSADTEEQVCTGLQRSEMYAIQVNELTEIGGKAQLLAFICYIGDGKIVEEFLCCKEW
jgi:hypothetical protein